MIDNKKKIMLIGGEGFIGRNLADVLCEKFECLSLGIQKSIFEERKDKFIQINPYVEKIDNKSDIYIHLIDNKVSGEEFLKDEESLVKNLEIQPDKHLILFSSAVIYANPNSDYGKRKLALEDFYKNYCINNNINLTILRLFNTYGEFQFPYCQGSLVTNIFYNYINNITIEINDMNAKRDFVYSKDIAKVVQYVIENKIFGTYDLATGKLITIRELIENFKKFIFSNEMNVQDKNVIENITCPAGNNFLYDKINMTPFLEGLKQTHKFYIDNNQLIKNRI